MLILEWMPTFVLYQGSTNMLVLHRVQKRVICEVETVGMVTYLKITPIQWLILSISCINISSCPDLCSNSSFLFTSEVFSIVLVLFGSTKVFLVGLFYHPRQEWFLRKPRTKTGSWIPDPSLLETSFRSFLEFRRLWHLEHIESFEISLILQLLHLLAGIFIIWTLHSGISVSEVTLDHFANFGRFWGWEMELFESGKELFELDIGWLVWVELLTILSRRNKYIWIQSKIENVEVENFAFRNLQRRRDSMMFSILWTADRPYNHESKVWRLLVWQY